MELIHAAAPLQEDQSGEVANMEVRGELTYFTYESSAWLGTGNASAIMNPASHAARHYIWQKDDYSTAGQFAAKFAELTHGVPGRFEAVFPFMALLVLNDRYPHRHGVHPDGEYLVEFARKDGIYHSVSFFEDGDIAYLRADQDNNLFTEDSRGFEYLPSLVDNIVNAHRVNG